jgi:threonine aldolase
VASRRPYDFTSDNAAIIDPRILQALVACNSGVATAYGIDPESAGIDALFSDLFERETFVFAAPTGTAANALALGAVTPSYGAIFCHEKAHIFTTECGAPEFFSGGARQVPLPGAQGKLTPATLEDALKPYQSGSLHQLRAATLSLTQATDLGTIYSADELACLSELARSAGLKVHLDGARFANAMVRLGCTPADMSWKAGVDVVSFGTTKNGTMNAEVVLAFDRQIAQALRYLHKRAGFLQSKMRYVSVQLSAYLHDDLWINNARRANVNADRLVAAIDACDGAWLENPVQANEVFVHLTEAAQARLEGADILLRPWPHPDGRLFRAVASFDDSDELLHRFEVALSEHERPRLAVSSSASVPR